MDISPNVCRMLAVFEEHNVERIKARCKRLRSLATSVVGNDSRAHPPLVTFLAEIRFILDSSCLRAAAGCCPG